MKEIIQEHFTHKKVNPKLIIASEILSTHMPFFAEFTMSMKFIETKFTDTIGVCFTCTGIHCYYNEKHINSRTQENINYVMLHEIGHILAYHLFRGFSKEYAGYSRLVNVCKDIFVDKIIMEEIYPKNARLLDPYWIIPKPAEYTGADIWEDLFDWYRQNKQAEQQTMIGSNLPIDGNGETKDCHSIPSEIPQELAQAMVKEIVESAKNRGLIKGEYENFLNRIQKAKKDYITPLLKAVSQLFGTKKTKTWFKPNRKSLPIKGHKKVTQAINCILDTSGSMANMIEIVLSYIVKRGIIVNLIQCDTEVHGITEITSLSQLQKTAIKGYGGTILQPAIDFLCKKNHYGNLVILTDGYTDTLDFDKFGYQVLILTTGQNCPVINGGKVEQIVIEK